MKLTLLGVMGSVPGGNSDLGKNTTCLLIEDNSNNLLIDAGTGIMNYFDSTLEKEHHILFTHYHLDHIVGLPFISQLYSSSNAFHFYGPDLHGFSTKNILPSLFTDPLLPIELDDISSLLTHKQVIENHTFTLNSFQVIGRIVEHPGTCMVYSISKNGKKITILTDFPDNPDNLQDIISFAKNSDIIYIDGYLTKDEMRQFSDYGHSSIESAIELFEKTNSGKLLISHHKSNRLYETIKKYETEKIIIAKEDDSYKI